MPTALRPPGLMRVTLILFRREVGAKLASPWLYCVASAVCLMAWLYGVGFAHTFETESVLVTIDPLMALNIIVVTFLGLVLGLRLSTSIAWEREHRMLEVLVAGPVSFEAVVAAKFLVELCIFAGLVAIYVAYLVIAQPLGAGVTGIADALSAGQMPLYALPTLALGLAISAWARTVRGAVVAYLVLVGLLASFEIALGLLLARPAEELSLAALYLKGMLQGAAWLLRPVSAIGQLAGLVEGLIAQASLGAMKTLLALALTLATLGGAIVLSRRQGAMG